MGGGCGEHDVVRREESCCRLDPAPRHGVHARDAHARVERASLAQQRLGEGDQEALRIDRDLAVERHRVHHVERRLRELVGLDPPHREPGFDGRVQLGFDAPDTFRRLRVRVRRAVRVRHAELVGDSREPVRTVLVGLDVRAHQPRRVVPAQAREHRTLQQRQLARVASRGEPSHLPRLHHGDVQSSAGEEQRGRQARQAGADDHDVASAAGRERGAHDLGGVSLPDRRHDHSEAR